ncbi:DUF2793 domain-containing protein [Brevundimonas sp.]|uniref:DUF2793 domain-containing protein n=1 Tax=Brevundimonas sp. TaxID=1871086 RepID=UPI003BA91A7C
MSGDTSARLGLPYLAAGQLQKHVTLNEALTRLDSLVHARVVSRTTAGQPSAPEDGALYLLPASATGSAWASQPSGAMMRAELGSWSVVAMADGLIVWVEDEGVALVRHGGAWRLLGAGLGEVQGLTRLGLNTTADGSNPFAARINKALWTALGAGEGGDGDLRLTFNKETAGDVLSLLFQSGYAGRAELGLIGGDDLTLKVSADGSTWRSALTVNRATGAVDCPAGCGRSETTVLAASGIYVVPAWARRIEAVVVGGGGGGGAGAAGATGASRFGGGGGGAGGISFAGWNTGDLASSLSVVVGGGGAGGAGGSSAGGAGGVSGANSTITSSGTVLITGLGGAAGQGGGAASGTGGLGGAGLTVANRGGDSAVTATSGAGAALDRPDGSGGGGAGGGLASTNTVRAGGAGGQGGTVATPAAGGTGGSGAVGGAGVAASTAARSWASGGGGGGGASVATGYAGGAGAPGAGGGGGGAGVTASGSGGAGGGGLVRIVAMG